MSNVRHVSALNTHDHQHPDDNNRIACGNMHADYHWRCEHDYSYTYLALHVSDEACCCRRKCRVQCRCGNAIDVREYQEILVTIPCRCLDTRRCQPQPRHRRNRGTYNAGTMLLAILANTTEDIASLLDHSLCRCVSRHPSLRWRLPT
jgi:hypothetical protein